MANQYSVNATQLRENEVILLKGRTTFSRLARLVEGADLAASDARRVANGMQAVGRPHTTITVADAEVIAKDPNNLTLEEQFVSERRYTSAKHPEYGMCYGIDNKSARLPIIAKLNEKGQAEQVQLEGELAADVPVVLVLRTYKPKGYANKGLSLDQVIVQDTEIKYFVGGAANEALAAAGIVFAGPIVPQVNNVAAPEPTGPVGQVSNDVDPQTQAAQSAGAWPTAAPAQTPAPAQSAPAQTEDDDIEALQRRLAEAQARKQAAENSGSNSAFNPQPISYNG